MKRSRSGAVSWEAIAVVVSIVALFITVISPFIVYKYLQDEIRIQQFKASSLRASRSESSSKLQNGKVEQLSYAYIATISNEGELPVKDVQLIIEYLGYDDEFEKIFDKVTVITTPPIQVTQSVTNNTLFVTLNNPLTPKDTVRLLVSIPYSRTAGSNVELNNSMIRGWLRSEAAPALPIPP